MKNQLLSFLLTMLLCMIGATSFAFDIEVMNDDGVTIYFCWTNNNTELEVIYHGWNSKRYSGNVVIPECVTYNGSTYSVTSIGDDAFDGCSGLTSVTIPNSVTNIGDHAFSRCSGLTSVTIPNSVTKIGDDAFWSCSGLTSVMIPNSVTSIGEWAFASCSRLTSATIGNSVTSIGDAAFWDCSGLTSVTIGNSVTSIGERAFESCSRLTSVMIPNSVTSIGEWAFASCSRLTSATIGNSVTSIGDAAFWDCSGLTSVTIGNSVTSIGERAFESCSRLTSITIPNSVTSIGSQAFLGCSGLTSVTIPNSVTSIGNLAFNNCISLTSVTIPSGVTSIGYSAFSGCSCLTSITIPSGLTSIGSNAFGNCSNITIVKVSVSDYSSFCNNIVLGSIYSSIGKPVLLIDGEGAEIEEYVVPKGVTSIGSSAFRNCGGLTSITISNDVTSIGDNSFYGCNGLTSITIPGSVTSIGTSAFGECSNINTVKVSVSDYSSFCNNKVLDCIYSSIRKQVLLIDSEGAEIKEYVVPEGVTSIGSSAFRNCGGLTSVTISNDVTSIGDNAFRGCSSLSSVTIGYRVKSIGKSVFNSCNSLWDVYCWAEIVPNTQSDAFQSSYIEYATLYVPATSIEDYKVSAPWKNFKSIVELSGEDISDKPKCATPTIIVMGNKIRFECETPGAEFESTLTTEENFTGNEVVMDNDEITYTLTVYATAPDYDRSKPAKVSFTIDKCDVNNDSTIDVADIASIISRMAGK